MGSLTHMTCRGTWSAAHLVSGDQFPSWMVEAFWREPICGEKTMRRFLWRALPLCSASNPTWLVEPSGEPWKCSRQWDKTKSWGFVMAENPMEPSQQDWGLGLYSQSFQCPGWASISFPMGGRAAGGHFHPVWQCFLEEQRNSGHKKLSWVQETHPHWGRWKAQGQGRWTSRMESDWPRQQSLKICQPCSLGDNKPYRLQAQGLRVASAVRPAPSHHHQHAPPWQPRGHNLGRQGCGGMTTRIRQRNAGDGPARSCVPWQASSTEQIRAGGGENIWGQVKFKVLINLLKKWF